MDTKEAIVAFSQGDKIKSALIWAAQTVEYLPSLPPIEINGAEQILKLLLNTIQNEINLAHRLNYHEDWEAAAKHLDTALVMVNSGVAQDAGFHLTQALSRVTSVSHRAMTFLKDQQLI